MREVINSGLDIESLFLVFGNSFEYRFMPIFAPFFVLVDFPTFDIVSPFRGNVWVGFPGIWGLITVTKSVLVFFVVILLFVGVVLLQFKKGTKARNFVLRLVFISPILFLSSINSFGLSLVIASVLLSKER